MSLSNELSKRGVLQIDNFHEDPLKIRNIALSQDYGMVPDQSKPGGGVAKRAACDSRVWKITMARVSKLLGRTPDIHLMQFRYTNQYTRKKAVCHTDINAGKYAGFVYLTASEYCQGGTSFFRHIESGVIGLQAKNQSKLYDFRNPDHWQCYATAEMQFNRCIILPSGLFHSVAMPYFGHSIEDARLTQVFWFS